MDKYDLLEAMNGIRDQFIEDAADPRIMTAQNESNAPDAASPEAQSGIYTPHVVAPEAQAEENELSFAAAASGAESGTGGRTRRWYRKIRIQRFATAVAALVCLTVLLPVLNPGISSAFRGVPLIGDYFRFMTVRSQDTQDESAGSPSAESAVKSAGTAGASDDSDAQNDEVVASGEEADYEEAAGESQEAAREAVPAGGALSAQDFEVREESDAESAAEISAKEGLDPGGTVAKQARDSVRKASSDAKITDQIRETAGREIAGYEKSAEVEIGYDSLRFLHEVVTDSDNWFCLRVLAYTDASDGYEQVTHFNIDKATGECTGLADLFPDGADYVTPISENIREQMLAQMKADPDVEYWIASGGAKRDDFQENRGGDFQTISPDQDYYLNQNGELVICFNEMEAAPLYMGALEFTIPAEITESAGLS